MQKRKILISTSTFATYDRKPLSMLEDAGLDYVLNPYGRKMTREEIMKLLEGSVGLVAGTECLDEAVLSRVPTLRVISRCGASCDNIDLKATERQEIAVFNTPDAPTNAVAELALAGILNLLRKVSFADRCIRASKWKKEMGFLLREKTVGILGLGRIGKCLVQLLQPFNVKIFAYDIEQDNKFAANNNVTYSDLDYVVAQADILSLHLPYSEDTHHVIDQRRIALMKPNGFLINLSRGGLVDETALTKALRDGRLAGAYLDTFEEEPYQGPLCDFPNVLLTPHVGSYAIECRVRMETKAVTNLIDYLKKNEKKAFHHINF